MGNCPSIYPSKPSNASNLDLQIKKSSARATHYADVGGWGVRVWAVRRRQGPSQGGEGKWAVDYLRAGSSPSPIGTGRRIAAASNYIYTMCTRTAPDLGRRNVHGGSVWWRVGGAGRTRADGGCGGGGRYIARVSDVSPREQPVQFEEAPSVVRRRPFRTHRCRSSSAAAAADRSARICVFPPTSALRSCSSDRFSIFVRRQTTRRLPRVSFARPPFTNTFQITTPSWRPAPPFDCDRGTATGGFSIYCKQRFLLSRVAKHLIDAFPGENIRFGQTAVGRSPRRRRRHVHSAGVCGVPSQRARVIFNRRVPPRRSPKTASVSHVSRPNVHARFSGHRPDIQTRM